MAVEPQGPTAVATDARLEALGLRRPRVARATPSDLTADPASWLLQRAFSLLSTELDLARPIWRQERVVVIVGTSSGGMWCQTRAFDAIALGQVELGSFVGAPYWGPLNVIRESLPGAPLIQVLAACASSALALGIGCELLHHGGADLVIAGGYDALTPFVAAGFEALGATTTDRPLPFSLARDGLALGEGAALLALARDSGPGPWLTGFGASADASHPTSPAESGSALVRAGRRALDAAGGSAGQTLVSAHATATPANDRAEAAAISELGLVQGIHAFKARIGHALGAGSALELLSALTCLQRGVCPALEHPPFESQLDIAASAPQPLSTRRVLKLASAFGGANAAIVADLDPPQPSDAEQELAVWLAACGAVCEAARFDDLVSHGSLEAIHVRRMDALSALCASAALDVMQEFPYDYSELEHTGIVVGSVFASMEHNAEYQARLRDRGHARADARRFPATSPNLAPGMVSILFGLGGPCTSVGAGYQAPFEALLVAMELLSAGQARHMLVVVADHVGPNLEALTNGVGGLPPTHGALALRLTTEGQEGNGPSLLGLRSDILARLIPTSVDGWSSALAVKHGSGPVTRPGWPALCDWLKEHGLPHP